MINTYAQYWNYVDHLVTNAYDIDDFTDAILHQHLIADSTILKHTSQSPYTAPDVALYLDAIKMWNKTRALTITK